MTSAIPSKRTLLFALIVAALCALLSPEAPAQSRTRQRADDTAPAAPSPQLYKSANFHVMTDLPEGEADALLKRLETMLKLVSAYFGRRNPRAIEMYVIDDFDNWPEATLATMDPDGILSVRTGGGVTFTQTISSGDQFIAKAVVYAGPDHGTPQHEAVHAYCGQAFGRTGPVWYSEGMAEVGNYWRENDKSVTADPRIIEYLQSGDPRPLDQIVNNPLETTGDSWQNYAWRWALCHLLGFNENYTDRFKPLGLALLAGRDADFWQVYGTQSDEIEFEYKLFLADMQPGYRCDLCSWDWKTRSRGLQGSAKLQAVVRADRGWQASRLKLFAGTTYAYQATGEWTLGPADPIRHTDTTAERRGSTPPLPTRDTTAAADPDLTADGAEDGRGRLIGVIFHDYELSAPFDLGTTGEFTPDTDGELFVRCSDDWGQLADNKGRVTLKLSLAKDESAPDDPTEPEDPTEFE
jgi:hypothetical protein